MSSKAGINEVSVAYPQLAAWIVVQVSHGLIHDSIVQVPPPPTS